MHSEFIEKLRSSVIFAAQASTTFPPFWGLIVLVPKQETPLMAPPQFIRSCLVISPNGITDQKKQKLYFITYNELIDSLLHTRRMELANISATEIILILGLSVRSGILSVNTISVSADLLIRSTAGSDNTA